MFNVGMTKFGFFHSTILAPKQSRESRSGARAAVLRCPATATYPVCDEW
jgi:hypothetical protein